MDNPQFPQILCYLAGVIILFTLGRLFLSPLKTAVCLVLHGMAGLFLLLLLHTFSGALPAAVAVNGVTVCVSALFGIPGVLLLVLLQLLGI